MGETSPDSDARKAAAPIPDGSSNIEDPEFTEMSRALLKPSQPQSSSGGTKALAANLLTSLNGGALDAEHPSRSERREELAYRPPGVGRAVVNLARACSIVARSGKYAGRKKSLARRRFALLSTEQLYERASVIIRD
jgi:hypothetical protein